MSSQKYPWIKFWLKDWRADERLRQCSLAARGLWIELICLMRMADDEGYFCISKNKANRFTLLSRQVGCEASEAEAAWGELDAAGVFSWDGPDRIYSRKILRDLEISTIRAEAGAKGGRSLLKQNKSKVEPKDKAKEKQNPSPLLLFSSKALAVVAKKIRNAYPHRRRSSPSADEKSIRKALDRIAKGGDRPDGWPDDERWPTQDYADWLVARVQLFAASAKGQAGTYCPLLTTWFNQSGYSANPETWEDGGGGEPMPRRTPDDLTPEEQADLFSGPPDPPDDEGDPPPDEKTEGAGLG